MGALICIIPLVDLLAILGGLAVLEIKVLLGSTVLQEMEQDLVVMDLQETLDMERDLVVLDLQGPLDQEQELVVLVVKEILDL